MRLPAGLAILGMASLGILAAPAAAAPDPAAKAAYDSALDCAVKALAVGANAYFPDAAAMKAWGPREEAMKKAALLAAQRAGQDRDKARIAIGDQGDLLSDQTREDEHARDALRAEADACMTAHGI